MKQFSPNHCVWISLLTSNCLLNTTQFKYNSCLVEFHANSAFAQKADFCVSRVFSVKKVVVFRLHIKSKCMKDLVRGSWLTNLLLMVRTLGLNQQTGTPEEMTAFPHSTLSSYCVTVP